VVPGSPVFSAGLSAFASRAALTADIQSTQSMLLGSVHLQSKTKVTDSRIGSPSPRRYL
jgi:hypothetical protein